MDSPSSAHELALQFHTLNEYLRNGTDGVPAVQRLVNLAVVSVPGCAWAGVTAWSAKGKAKTVASTGRMTELVDEIQYDLREGPCLTAAVEADLEPVRIDDLTEAGRWPTFCREILQRTQVRSVLAFHLDREAAQRYALNLYGDRPRAFTGDAMDIGALFASHARALMLHSASAAQVANLSEALTSSRQIGTAVGILMAMHKITAGDAFDMLSKASQDLNRKLRDVADDVTRTGALPPSGRRQI